MLGISGEQRGSGGIKMMYTGSYVCPWYDQKWPPKSYGDWRNNERNNDEGNWFLSEYLGGSDYSGGSVTRSNVAVFKEEHKDYEWEFWVEVHGGYGTYQIVINLKNLPKDHPIYETLNKLENYPILDENDHSEKEMEAQDEAWDNWVRREFLDAIGYNDLSLEDQDLLTEDVMYEIFRTCCDNTNTYWEEESDGFWIDVDRLTKDYDIEEDLKALRKKEEN
jgi:hypothetical protein